MGACCRPVGMGDRRGDSVGCQDGHLDEVQAAAFRCRLRRDARVESFRHLEYPVVEYHFRLHLGGTGEGRRRGDQVAVCLRRRRQDECHRREDQVVEFRHHLRRDALTEKCPRCRRGSDVEFRRRPRRGEWMGRVLDCRARTRPQLRHRPSRRRVADIRHHRRLGARIRRQYHRHRVGCRGSYRGRESWDDHRRIAVQSRRDGWRSHQACFHRVARFGRHRRRGAYSELEVGPSIDDRHLVRATTMECRYSGATWRECGPHIRHHLGNRRHRLHDSRRHHRRRARNCRRRHHRVRIRLLHRRRGRHHLRRDHRARRNFQGRVR
jgi:hypothetical protein